ncbi:MAG: hypothetical protein ACP5JU_03770 [Minisyncoccia bacterium]
MENLSLCCINNISYNNYGILASITPAGNAIIDFTGLTGVKAGEIWLSIAIISGLLTSFAYNQEKKKGL